MNIICPHCNNIMKMDDCNFEDLYTNDYIDNIKCNNCDNEFDLRVTFKPIGHPEKIKLVECMSCHNKEKERYCYNSNSFEFNNLLDIKLNINKGDYLCKKCFYKQSIKINPKGEIKIAKVIENF